MVQKKIKNIFFWIGAGMVILTHTYMLVAGLSSSQVVAHSVVNIIAAGLIIYGRDGCERRKIKKP